MTPQRTVSGALARMFARTLAERGLTDREFQLHTGITALECSAADARVPLDKRYAMLRLARRFGEHRDALARLDYGYQAAAKLTPMAKALIAKGYGKGPDRSYIGDCSNGERHRHLATVATDPADLSSAFTAAERALLSASVVARCDAPDGAMIWGVPPADPATFNGPQYALTVSNDAKLAAVGATDATYTESGLSFMLPVEQTDLRALKQRGASSTCSSRWLTGSSRERLPTACARRYPTPATRSASTPTCRQSGRRTAAGRSARTRRWRG